MAPSSHPSVGLVFALIMALVGIAILVFWIKMLIDCLTSKTLSGSEKIVWALVILITGILGALIYYFVGRKKP